MLLHLFAVLVACSTAILIFAGGLVTSTGSGLAVPDWPNTYGWNMFTFPIDKWVGGISVQITLGALTILGGKDHIINSRHVVTGGLVLVPSLVLALRAHRVRFGAPRAAWSAAA